MWRFLFPPFSFLSFFFFFFLHSWTAVCKICKPVSQKMHQFPELESGDGFTTHEYTKSVSIKIPEKAPPHPHTEMRDSSALRLIPFINSSSSLDLNHFNLLMFADVFIQFETISLFCALRPRCFRKTRDPQWTITSMCGINQNLTWHRDLSNNSQIWKTANWLCFEL